MFLSLSLQREDDGVSQVTPVTMHRGFEWSKNSDKVGSLSFGEVMLIM